MMKNFTEFKNEYISFTRLALPALKQEVSRFFNCDVKFIAEPLNFAIKTYSIDLTITPRRGFYLIDDNTAFILGRVIESRQTVVCFALELTNGNFSSLSPFLQTFEGVLSHLTTYGFKTQYTQGAKEFGESMIVETIGKHFGKGRFGYQNIVKLSEIFQRLSNSKFEGEAFSTGLIVSRASSAYSSERDDKRSGGSVLKLTQPIEVSLDFSVDKRFWYLVDGKTSFFLCRANRKKKPEIVDTYFLSAEYNHGDSYIDSYTFSQTLKGSDILLRVVGPGEVSILGATGLEVLYKEGGWRVRSLSDFQNLIRKYANTASEVAEAIVSIVLKVSQVRKSAIIWMPTKQSEQNDILLSKNQAYTSCMTVLNPDHHSTIIRAITSDGATVINATGEVEHYGCLVDMSKIEAIGISGAGEAVGQVLGKNGIAVKVSQDGDIKVYYNILKQVF
ncbi:hypothetical protein ACXIUY_23565 [Vibrio parahaemolyticus]|uniref:hypothetical protein n=2 Tax=Vibrio parahaemolyticus TaxID=670 RepID=UPI0011230F0E|nr:hypothetical protein [Vibrio parahaemolyticus]TOI97564.1 hypothetical protein CGI48_23825 [Vibrio parahaemolyticus]HBC3912522.1 hypothetical protein [Vibrio parahaemolyticus]